MHCAPCKNPIVLVLALLLAGTASGVTITPENWHATETKNISFSVIEFPLALSYLVQYVAPNSPATVPVDCLLQEGPDCAATSCANVAQLDYRFVEGTITGPSASLGGQLGIEEEGLIKCAATGDDVVAAWWKISITSTGVGGSWAADARALASNGSPANNKTVTWSTYFENLNETQTDTTQVRPPNLQLSIPSPPTATITAGSTVSISTTLQNVNDASHSGNAFNVVFSLDSSSPSGCASLVTAPLGIGTLASGASQNQSWSIQFNQTINHDCAFTLKALSDGGYQGTTTSTVRVNAAPTADFVLSPSSARRNVNFSFDASPSNDPDGAADIVSYSWAFGDGGTATGKTTTHSYSAIGSFNVTLTVQDSDGATSSVSKTAQVVNGVPTANFSITPSTGDRTISFSFDGASSSDPDNDSLSYAWDFGDNATGSGQAATHQFGAPGNYSVRLTVTDSQGGSNSLTKTLTVTNRAPSANFTVSPTSGNSATVFGVDGSTTSDPDGDSISSYHWDWGDDATSTGVTSTHSYAANGTYNIQLTATDQHGATGTKTKSVTVSGSSNNAPTASFNVTPAQGNMETTFSFDAGASSDPDGHALSYDWVFGDNTTGTGKTKTHAYAAPGSYTVKLTVTDSLGAKNSVEKSVSVFNDAPLCSFSITPSSGTTDTTFSVNASGTQDNDGTIASYAWTWGDSATSTGMTATHKYSAGGAFTVKLTATDDFGAKCSTTRDVVVTGTNNAPEAVFAFAPSSGDTSVTFTFDATDSYDPDGDAITYKWVWGDGSSDDTAQISTHRFNVSGSREVKLVVTDSKGASKQSTKNVTVRELDCTPSKHCLNNVKDCGEQARDCGGACTAKCPEDVTRIIEYYCGDGDCLHKENCTTCPSDCGNCPKPPASCGNGTCEPASGEACTNCVGDCGVCPDGSEQDQPAVNCSTAPQQCAGASDGRDKCDPIEKICVQCYVQDHCASGTRCENKKCVAVQEEDSGNPFQRVITDALDVTAPTEVIETTEIIVVVKNAAGAPVADALVYVEDQIFATDFEGKAKFKLKPGEYSARVSANGYLDKTVHLTVNRASQEPLTPVKRFQELSFECPEFLGWCVLYHVALALVLLVFFTVWRIKRFWPLNALRLPEFGKKKAKKQSLKEELFEKYNIKP